MSENIPQNFEVCNTEGESKDIHSFHTIPPDLRGSVSQKVEIIESDERIYKKINEYVIEPKEKKMKKLNICICNQSKKFWFILDNSFLYISRNY